jgi:hypothetical protein
LARAISNGLLALVSTALALCAAEALLTWTPLGDPYGWGKIPTIPERIAAVEPKPPGEWRLLGLGDSFAAFREAERANFLRIAEAEASGAGFPVRLVNLGQSATGLRDYTRNLERWGESIRPDVTIAALYLGNDVFQYKLEALERAAPPFPAASGEEPTWSQVIGRELVEHSALSSLVLRAARGWIPALRSGTLERSLLYLEHVYGLDADEVERHLSRADPDLVARARADQVNPWDLAVAVAEPRLYLDMLALDEASGHAAAAREFLEGLEGLESLARRSGTELAFVLIPPSPAVSVRYHGYFARMGYAMSPELASGKNPLVRAIEDHLGARGIRYLDLTPALRAAPGNLFLPDDIHFDSHGQRVAGLALAEFLESQGLLGPGSGGVGQRLAGGASRGSRAK